MKTEKSNTPRMPILEPLAFISALVSLAFMIFSGLTIITLTAAGVSIILYVTDGIVNRHRKSLFTAALWIICIALVIWGMMIK